MKKTRFEIALDGTVFVETETQEEVNGQLSMPTIERRSFSPGSDVSGQDNEVRAVCATAWTDQVVAEFNAKREQRLENFLPQGVA